MRWKAYIGSIAGILVLRFLDLYTTYLYTPDLGREWNPLVSILGASWLSFIITQIIIIAFVSSLIFFYFNRTPNEPVQKGLGFYDFIYVYFFGKLKPWRERIFTMPTNLKKHLVFNGFLFLVISILLGCFAIINNLLLIAGVESYIRFLVKNYKTFFPISFILVTIFAVYLYFGIEYYKYKRAPKIA